MTLSAAERRTNRDSALRLLLAQLGDNFVLDCIFMAGHESLSEILPTSWIDLEQLGYVRREPGGGRAFYRLTGAGWLAALRVSDGISEEFKQRLGSLLAYLKRGVEGRTDHRLVHAYQVAKDLNMPAGWIENVVEANAIEQLWSRQGPRWHAGKAINRVIEIPANLGMTGPA